MKNPFSRKIRRSFVAFTLALLLCSSISLVTIYQAKKKEEWVQHTHFVIQRLEYLLSLMKDAETGARGYIIARQPKTLAPYNRALTVCPGVFNEIKTLTRDNVEQQATLQVLSPQINKQFSILAGYVSLIDNGNQVSPAQIDQGKQVMDLTRTLVNQMIDREYKLLTNRNLVWHQLWGYVPVLIAILTIVSIIGSSYFCRSLLNSYLEKIRFRRQLQKQAIIKVKRIKLIQAITAEIANGNYSLQITGQERDLLGILSEDINRMTVALDESFKRLQDLMDKKDEFINITAHEFRTPLTSIQATLQIISRLKLSSDEFISVSPFIQKASNQVKRLSAILKDLLDVSRINSNNLLLNLSDFSITELIEEGIEEIQAEKVSQVINFSRTNNFEVHGDKVKIAQVFANLLSNAVKYSFQGSTIQVAVFSVENAVRVEIVDEGNGIPSDKLPFVFDRYFRVEKTSKNYSGMGLGLYIAKEIIERHGGQVGVESTVGKGTTFWFTLPVKL